MRIGVDIATVAVVLTIALLILGAVTLDGRDQRRRRVKERLSRYCLNTEDETVHTSRDALRQRVIAWIGVIAQPVVAGLFTQEKDRRIVSQLLVSAGFRSDNALSVLAAAKASVALGFGAAAYGLVVLPDRLGSGLAVDLIAVAGATIIGAILPEYLLRLLAGRRREAMRDALPDAIDLMVIAAQAGLSLDMALDRVTREMRSFAPELATEFNITLAELQALPDRAEAVQNLGDRIGVKEVQSFSLTLMQTIRYGTPFAASLKALSQDLRLARMIALEERGAKLPALLSLPLIVFIMPAVFVVVVGPAIISIIESFG